MELYGAARSSASFRVRIALAYKGLAHDSRYVSLVKGEHAEAKYRSINTQGLVPALVDEGRLFAQSLAIMSDTAKGPIANPNAVSALSTSSG